MRHLIVSLFFLSQLAMAQNPMPTNSVSKLVGGTNAFQIDGYTLTWNPAVTQVVVNADSGIAGYSMDATGTNPVLVSGSAPSFSNGKIDEVIREETAILDWYDTSTILWSPDLVNWYAITAAGHFSICLPVQNQMFFKLK